MSHLSGQTGQTSSIVLVWEQPKNAAWDSGTLRVNRLNELWSCNRLSKMCCLSYIAYFHNLDAVCMCVCVCVFICLCMCMCTYSTRCVYWQGLSMFPPRVCMCVCARACVYRHAPEFRGSDSFDSYTCQWPDPGDNPCCRHKADRKAPISPPDTRPVSGGSRGGRETTSNHSPQYTLLIPPH